MKSRVIFVKPEHVEILKQYLERDKTSVDPVGTILIMPEAQPKSIEMSINDDSVFDIDMNNSADVQLDIINSPCDIFFRINE